jgi:hypothetical protein
LPSACSFIVDGLAFFCRCSHYMFRPTWLSSGVYDILLFILEGICFAVFVAFVACCYIVQFLICVCFCCVSVNFHILVCVFGFLAFLCCLSGLYGMVCMIMSPP